MARTFRGYLEAISPTTLKLPNGFGVRFMQGFLGYFGDLVMTAATEAIKAPWVEASTSPDDALPSIGVNVNIAQAPGETSAEFRLRLTDNPGAWTLWAESATGDFADNAFQPFGLAAADVELHTRNTWLRIQFPNAWSRWWVVLGPTIPWTEELWGDPSLWGDVHGTWGSSAMLVEIGGALGLLEKWKSAHEVGVLVILNYDDHVWGAGTVWGAPGTWGISGVVRWRVTKFWDQDGIWGDVEPYRSWLPGTWGGKVRIS